MRTLFTVHDVKVYSMSRYTYCLQAFMVNDIRLIVNSCQICVDEFDDLG
ncbi:MAG: hypothetical protein IPN80_00765 [Flavobacterium sp.]|nr:hypothetical protein [Flavobacterium sp.]